MKMITFGDFTTSEPLREILDIPVWDASKKVVKVIKVKTAAQEQKDAYAVNKEEKEMKKVQEEEWGVGHNPTNFVIKTRPIRSKNARRRENKQNTFSLIEPNKTAKYVMRPLCQAWKTKIFQFKVGDSIFW